MITIRCCNPLCPAAVQTGKAQVIGEVAGTYRLKCSRCRQYSIGRTVDVPTRVHVYSGA